MFVPSVNSEYSGGSRRVEGARRRCKGLDILLCVLVRASACETLLEAYNPIVRFFGVYIKDSMRRYRAE